MLGKMFKNTFYTPFRHPFKTGKKFMNTCVGVDTIKNLGQFISLPFKKKYRTPSNDPEELKSLTFDELLERWNIPQEAVPRIKRNLFVEMGFFFLLACFGLSFVAVKFVDFSYSWFGTFAGLFIAIIAILSLLMRHHWYSIITREKYFTFRDYLNSLRGKE